MNRKYLDKFFLTGALTGFLILHPLVMLLPCFMNTDNVAGNTFNLQGITAQVKTSFAPAMLP